MALPPLQRASSLTSGAAMRLRAAAAVKPHANAHDQRAVVETGLDAAHHAAFSPCCCSSQIKAGERDLLDVDPLDEEVAGSEEPIMHRSDRAYGL